MNDADEVDGLRARVAELEARLATEGEPAQQLTGRRSRWWAASSAILVTLGCVLAPLSVTAVWASSQLSNTDSYVQTVAPLADDPAVQAAIADEVTDAVFDNLDLEDLTAETLQSLAQLENVPPRVADALPGLAGPITDGIENFTRTQVNNLVASPEFAVVWNQVNRIAHEQVVTLLEGAQGGALSAQEDTITLNLAPIIAQVRAQLVDRGFTPAESISVIDRSFILVQSAAITDAQGFYRLLNTLGAWLPISTVVLLAGGVLLARNRQRTLLRAALGVTGAMLVFGVGLATARLWYVNTTPADILSSEAAGNVFDTLVRFLRAGLRATAVLGLVVALGAFLAGPSASAVRIRAVVERGIASLQGSAEAPGWQPGRFGTWIHSNKRWLRLGVFVAAGLVLLFWTGSTPWVIVTTTLIVAVALTVIEFVGRPRPSARSEQVGVTTAQVLPQQAPRGPAEQEPTPSAPKETAFHQTESRP